MISRGGACDFPAAPQTTREKSELNPKNIKLKDWLSYHMTVIKSLEKKSLKYKVAKFVQEWISPQFVMIIR